MRVFAAATLLRLCAGIYILQYDLDDNGRLDRSEFKKMLETLGSSVSEGEADAAFEVSSPGWCCHCRRVCATGVRVAADGQRECDSEADAAT